MSEGRHCWKIKRETDDGGDDDDDDADAGSHSIIHTEATVDLVRWETNGHIFLTRCKNSHVYYKHALNGNINII